MEVYGLGSKCRRKRSYFRQVPGRAARASASFLRVLSGDSVGADRDLRAAPVAIAEVSAQADSFLTRAENPRFRLGAAMRSALADRSRAPIDQDKTNTPMVSRVAGGTRSWSDSNRAAR